VTALTDHRDDLDRRADAIAVTTLLNCYLREAGRPVVDGERIRLPRLGLDLHVPVRYRSATGQHVWTLPVQLAPGTPLDAIALAVLIAVELAGPIAGPAEIGSLIGAVAESTRNVAAFLDAPPIAAETTPYLAAEQSLVAGHPLHPTPKSRAPMVGADVPRYAPELRTGFPLHWFAVDRSMVSEDSALAEPATSLLAGLLGAEPDTELDLARRVRDLGDQWALLPAHPWQARRLAAREDVGRLSASGRLVDLGPAGAPWYPTSSVRTVYRPDVPFQLKLTLEARITNSVRRNLRKELARGTEVCRLLAAGLAAELSRRYPAFDIVRDPAWATVDTGNEGESGFELVLRDNPYPATEPVDVSVVAALCADRADGGPPRVARLVRRIATAAGRPAGDVAREWFARFVGLSADPLLWLYTEWGVVLEAHQQNTLLELDDGWPAALRYRDNQGYYFADSHSDRLRGLLPTLNEASDTICADAVAQERLGYYLVVNNLLGLVGALGVGGVVDERVLLSDLADRLRAVAPDLPLVRRLVSEPVLRCKGNLRTRLADLDELTGELATQSVYVGIPNPLAGCAPAGWDLTAHAAEVVPAGDPA